MTLLCKDCQFYKDEGSSGADRCTNPELANPPDYVRGNSTLPYCDFKRMDGGKCGPEGKFFVQVACTSAHDHRHTYNVWQILLDGRVIERRMSFVTFEEAVAIATHRLAPPRQSIAPAYEAHPRGRPRKGEERNHEDGEAAC